MVCGIFIGRDICMGTGGTGREGGGGSALACPDAVVPMAAGGALAFCLASQAPSEPPDAKMLEATIISSSLTLPLSNNFWNSSAPAS